MATSHFLPFETVDATSSSSVRFEAWSLDDWEIPTDLSKVEWVFDPEVSTTLHRHYFVAPSILAKEVHQGRNAVFDLVVKVRSSHTGLRSHYDIASFGSTESEQDDVIYLEIPNTSLGGRLEICTRILIRNPDPNYTFAATEPGSIVFEDITVQDMEGTADLFPRIEAQDLDGFLGIVPGPHWMIDVQSVDLNTDKTQAITLSINSSSKTGQAIIERRTEAEGYMRALLADLYRRIIDCALSSDDFKAEVDSKGRTAFQDHPRSLGRLMLTTMALCGLPTDPYDARALREGRPHEYEARILNHAHKVLAK